MPPKLTSNQAEINPLPQAAQRHAKPNKPSNIRLKFSNEVHESAQANMSADEALLLAHQHHLTEVWVRLYTWKKPGITLPKSRLIPDELKNVDIGKRLTGGGIVFHAPGDLVFSVIAALDNPAFPKPLKQKMGVITQWFRTALTQTYNNVTSHVSESSTQNIQFCKTYHNPNELMIDGEKILGLTLKRTRTQWIVQGILHLSPNAPYFSMIDDDYLIKKLNIVNKDLILDQLKSSISADVRLLIIHN